MVAVSFGISLSFVIPISGISEWGGTSVLACVLVPETAVHENNLSPGDEDDVRFARQALDMERVAIAHRVGELSYAHFGSSIRPLDRSHALATLLRTKVIWQGRSLLCWMALFLVCAFACRCSLNGNLRECDLAVLKPHE